MSFATQNPPIYIKVCVCLYLVTPISKLTGPLVFNDVFRGFIQFISIMQFKAGKQLLAYKEHFCFLELVNILKSFTDFVIYTVLSDVLVFNTLHFI